MTPDVPATPPEAPERPRAWLWKPAMVREWERIAVWLSLFFCMGWKLHIPQTVGAWIMGA